MGHYRKLYVIYTHVLMILLCLSKSVSVLYFPLYYLLIPSVYAIHFPLG